MLAVMLVVVLIVVGLDIACMNYCLDDLNRRVTTTGGTRQLWTAIIIMGGPVGQAAYWLYGRGPY
jgi:hypothetical protein